jgi:hypothetical protein
MADAVYNRGRHDTRVVLAAAASSGEVRQLADGRAGVLQGLSAGAISDTRTYKTDGKHVVTKTASQVWLDGAPIWWDHSANSATCVPPTTTGDRDFYLGTSVGDAASADTEGTVDLNIKPEYIIDVHRDGGDTAIVKTVVGSTTVEVPNLISRGGTLEAFFGTTAEAQKVDWLSKRSFPVGSKWILEAIVEVVTNADADVADLTVGVANGTHASDFQSVTEFATFHFDMGADLDLDAQSDDGTTDVAPTDTTINWAVGTPIHLVIDGRDHEDIQFYVDGVNVLPATVFTLTAATGPLKAIFHLEKSANDSPGTVQIDHLAVRIAEQ